MKQKRDVIIATLALFIGLLGAMFYLMIYHAWLDHKFVDDVRIQIQNQQQRAPAK